MSEKEKSPNPAIDKAIKKLMAEMDSQTASPDELKSKATVIKIAIDWEKAKHNIKDEETFDPNSI